VLENNTGDRGKIRIIGATTTIRQITFECNFSHQLVNFDPQPFQVLSSSSCSAFMGFKAPLASRFACLLIMHSKASPKDARYQLAIHNKLWHRSINSGQPSPQSASQVLWSCGDKSVSKRPDPLPCIKTCVSSLSLINQHSYQRIRSPELLTSQASAVPSADLQKWLLNPNRDSQLFRTQLSRHSDQNSSNVTANILGQYNALARQAALSSLHARRTKTSRRSLWVQ
jgi:hypothetical protein